MRSKIGVISAFHSHSLALTIAAKKMAATTVCRPSFLVPSFPTLAQLVKLALNNGVSFCALSRRHRSIPPVRQALGGREGGEEGGEEALPLTYLHACGHLRCHMAACNNRPCSTAGGTAAGGMGGRLGWAR